MKKRLLLSTLICSLCLVGCGGNADSTNNGTSDSTNVANKKYNNDKDALVFAITDLDGLFNPFYYSSGNDGTIAGMTQLSMFTTDKNGDIAYGDNEAVVVKDYQQVYDKTSDSTTYTFAIKNNIKYSNGSYLTLKDVLFNMYEYLDPAYTGSSTMYSTKIKGLSEYRTQQRTEAGQEAFEETFTQYANDRISQLIQVINEIDDEKVKGTKYTYEQYLSKLGEKEVKYNENSEFRYADKFVEDFEYVSETFKKELVTDYNNSVGTYEDLKLKSDVEAFLYNEGLITIDLDKPVGDPERIDYSIDQDQIAELDQQSAIDLVYQTYFPATFSTIVKYWSYTSTEVKTNFVAQAKEDYFTNLGDQLIYKNISGIKVITEDTKINDTVYHYAQYDSNGLKTAGSDNGYELFSITIDGVDPKAIWNFSFAVAPMYYYSNEEQINKFDYQEHFGVDYSKNSFQNDVIKNEKKIGLPVGAGSYKASDVNNNENVTESNEFKKSNVVYFVRNENFLMGSPKIKYIRYKVVPTNQMLNALTQKEVHYCEPSAKKEIIDRLNNLEDNGFSYVQARTLGYGYIGINAKYIPSVYARRALMSAMNTQLTTTYYVGAAEVIYRPMSKESWAYPDGVKAYYEYDPTGQKSLEYFKQAGYTYNVNTNKLVDSNGKQFKVKFTIAGETDDHPTAATFYNAQKILQSIGCDVEVTPDIYALTKLTTGSLEVWAAAWSTTIDPDMYQSYHKKSTASSTKNWGYDAIYADTTSKYEYERGIIDDLSDKIESARETLVKTVRKDIYAECLDDIMDLAVELPTYQRDDLFAYNSDFIDGKTMTPKSEVSAYNGPINQLWNLSLN